MLTSPSANRPPSSMSAASTPVIVVARRMTPNSGRRQGRLHVAPAGAKAIERPEPLSLCAVRYQGGGRQEACTDLATAPSAYGRDTSAAFAQRKFSSVLATKNRVACPASIIIAIAL